jgi:hypothetical protein
LGFCPRSFVKCVCTKKEKKIYTFLMSHFEDLDLIPPKLTAVWAEEFSVSAS